MAVASSGRPSGQRRRLSRIARFVAKTSLEKSANLLTSFRMASALPIAWLIYTGDDQLAAILFACAALSDALDGFLAKRFNACSTFGAIMDPLADKLLVISALAALSMRDLISAWLLALVVLRDVLLVMGGILLKWRHQSFSVRPLVIGKICTFLLLTTITVILANNAGWLALSLASEWQLLVAFALLASGFAYIGALIALLRED